MEFDHPKGIYQQIAEQLRDRILQGEWAGGERFPSIREMAVTLGVNPNTVTRSYQSMVDRGIIENRRGIGYFVTGEAERKILDERKTEFIREELPRIFRTMELLAIGIDELAGHFAAYRGRKEG